MDEKIEVAIIFEMYFCFRGVMQNIQSNIFHDHMIVKKIMSVFDFILVLT